MTDTQQASDEEIAALKVRGRYGHGERPTVDGVPVGPADTPEPLSTGFERVYAEIHGEPVAFISKTGNVSIIKGGALLDLVCNMPDPPVGKAVLPLYAHPDPAVERLQRELRLLREQQKEDFDRATSAEASLAAAREALKPFAAVAEHDIGESEDDADLFTPMSAHNRAPRLTVGDLRAARAILGDQPT